MSEDVRVRTIGKRARPDRHARPQVRPQALKIGRRQTWRPHGGRQTCGNIAGFSHRLLLALRTKRICRLAVNSIISHLQGCLIHPQWHDERDDLEDYKGSYHVIDDNERRPLRLKQEL
jgi:hypothetical protein